jgi:hypothetical protein
LVLVVILGAYFVYSARVEEKNMTPRSRVRDPAYRARPKMLIPFGL